jgi:SAM-dependent methyltransferase
VTVDFSELTELSGDDVTGEQVDRLARRYYWAASYCEGKDVLEVACGSGQGVGYLASSAKSVVAGDYSESLLNLARRHYGNRFCFHRFDAQEMPFPAASFDVVIIFEALYYLPDASRFFRECTRVLRPRGHVLISTANKDLFDFNPSPHSYEYFGVVELGSELSKHGFEAVCFGDAPLARSSWRQRFVRPLKAFAARAGMIPASMEGKKLLKRLVFGQLVRMPAEVDRETANWVDPVPLEGGRTDRAHKVTFCAAQLTRQPQSHSPGNTGTQRR